MRRRAAAIGIVTVTAAVLAGCAQRVRSARPAAVPAAAAVQIAVLGDSLAFGTGASDSSRGFAFLVFRSIDALRPGSEITNVAIGGSTARDVLRLQVPRLRERRFDVVLLCVGGNDVVRETRAATFAATYADLLAAIRRAAPQAKLIAVGVPDVAISPLFADQATAVRALARADDRAAHAAALAAGARYVDLFAVTRGQRDAAGFLSGDRFHPSDAGHERIAAAVLPAVTAALAGPQREARHRAG